MTSEKYTSRPSPPYSASACKGTSKIGNDGELWKSQANSKGTYKWKRIIGSGSGSSKKASPYKSSSPKKRKSPKKKKQD